MPPEPEPVRQNLITCTVSFFSFLFEEKNNEPWGMATIAFSKDFAALSVPLVGDILNALF